MFRPNGEFFAALTCIGNNEDLPQCRVKEVVRVMKRGSESLYTTLQP